MEKVISELMRVRLEDGSYMITLPINTVNEVFYNVKEKITLKDILDGLGAGGVASKGKTSVDLGVEIIKYEDLFGFSDPVSTVRTGIGVITLPKFYSNTTLSLFITGFSHTENSGWSVVINGFANSEKNEWEFCSAEIRGIAPFDTIRLCDNGETTCILLGDTDTIWTGTRLYIEKVFASNENITEWKETYGLEFYDSITPFYNVKNCTLIVSGGGGGFIVMGTDEQPYINIADRKKNTFYFNVTDSITTETVIDASMIKISPSIAVVFE